MNRILKEIEPPFSANDKRKMRTLFKQGLGLARNVSERVLANTIGVPQRLLYNYLSQDYNNYVRNQNENVLRQRRQQTQERRQFERTLKLIDTQDDITFTNLNKSKLEKILRKLITKTNMYIIRFNDKIYTLSDVTKERLINNIDDIYIQTEADGEGSDIELIDYIKDIKTITVEKVNPNYQFNQGAFFKYTHKLQGLDLSELQIYTKVDGDNYKDNCFIHALKGQVEEPIIQDCKDMIRGKHTTIKCIKEIAERHNLYISVKIDDTNIRHYGNKLNREVKMCLIDNHYIKWCDVEITSYAIKNYYDICHKERWNEIIDKTGKRKKNWINSYRVVKLLLENKDTHLTPISSCDELYKTCYYNDVKEISTLEYNEHNVVLNEYEYKVQKDLYLINVFFDFETITKGEQHIPYLCCVKSGKLSKCFEGHDCGKQMLEYLMKYFYCKNIKLIAHNLSYDLKFLFDYLCKQSYIKRGSQIMSGTACYVSFGKEQKIKFQDSYSLIPSKLSGFGKMFGIEQEKEFMPYDMYNYGFQYILVDEIKKHTDKQVRCNNIGKEVTEEVYNEYYDKFMHNAKKWKCIEGNIVDIYKYSKHYCEIDCDILEKGYNMFKQQIKEVCNLDIDEFVSVASIADTYLLKQDVYEGVYKLSGVVREFIQKCMVGGRTMCADNKKHYIHGKVDDFDAVSLYPSAMERLGGYLKGKPKVLNTCEYDIIKNYDGYFIEIKITKVGIKRSFSLMSEITDKGIRMFHNDMVGKILYVDKTTLEDMIQFQEIEFDVNRGYYYDEGRNNNLKNVIQYLFNERLRQKKLGNPIQNIFKLIMNSAYGKTLLKPIDDDTQYVWGEENMKRIILANYAFIKEVTLLGNNNYEIKLIKSINTHFNNASCGVEVLSMSKRIMNEVMCLAEDKGYNIYYQDTDSMHIDSDNVELLAKDYKEKYDRDLIGKQMGQFHTDFDSDILKGTIYAKESIFLGKKCYLDVLTDETGKEDYHIRMKGVSSVSVKHHAQKDFGNDISKIYKHLYIGKGYTFDLTCNALKPCFDMVNMNTIKTKTDFMRELVF